MQATPFLRDELVTPPTKHMRMSELSLPASVTLGPMAVGSSVCSSRSIAAAIKPQLELRR